jgi:hypothetical protein
MFASRHVVLEQNDEETATLSSKNIQEKNTNEIKNVRTKIIERISEKAYCSFRCKIAFTIILCLFSLFYYFMNSMLNDVHIDFTNLDANQTGDIENVHPDQLTAKIYGGGSISKKTCDDYNYGCCQIMTNCVPKTTYLDARSVDISVYKILPHDIIHSNCPSVDQLVHLYNSHYKDNKKHCSDSEYGCCPSVNTACDHTFHMIESNTDEMVDFYKNNINHIHHSLIAKKDHSGSNCPRSIYKYIEAYERNWPDEEDGFPYFLIVIIICLLWLSCGKH